MDFFIRCAHKTKLQRSTHIEMSLKMWKKGRKKFDTLEKKRRQQCKSAEESEGEKVHYIILELCLLAAWWKYDNLRLFKPVVPVIIKEIIKK